ncbi:MAG: tetratricopeptide repeat protein [Candidatus Sulfotelmatobacter sp.]
MRWKSSRWKRGVALAVVASSLSLSAAAFAGDITVKIPKRSRLTPVQRLNREGVEQLQKRNYERAEALFYKAYLYDPDDPFTLNNLGYIAELQGQVDRAAEFYKQAAELPTDAVIDQATSQALRGKPVSEALAIPDLPMRVNHDNVEAVRLLSKGRAPEADLLLQHTLVDDPRNVFTLNNLGVTKEMEGESQEALKYYDEAAASGADLTAVVTLSKSWRGKRASDMAARNAKALRARLNTENTTAAQVASLNLRGVSAMNRNDLQAAEKDFRAAYALDPGNAFAMNNIGYVAEMTGDRETAQFFYDSALRASGANMTVGLATRREAEGEKLFQVAGKSDGQVDEALTSEREARRQQSAPVQLLRRDNSVVEEPAKPVQNTAPQPFPK